MAQTWYLGGHVGFMDEGASNKYQNGNSFVLNITPTAGYEFNDQWAIEFGGVIAPNAGVEKYKSKYYSHKETFSGIGGGVFAYGRYTAWNNGILYIDLKFGDEFTASKYQKQNRVVFVPQLRARVHDHVDLGITLGEAALGVRIPDEGKNKFIYSLGVSAGVNCVYRF